MVYCTHNETVCGLSEMQKTSLINKNNDTATIRSHSEEEENITSGLIISTIDYFLS